MTRFASIGPVWLVCLAAVAVHAQQTIYVNGTTGNNAWNGLCEVWDGGICGPKLTIQAGIDVAQNGDTVQVADGAYTGEENKNLDFGGLAIAVHGTNGPENCIIDCEGSGRGFDFHNGETADAVVNGFTIQNGNVGIPGTGGGIGCYGSSPTVTNCVITGCSAEYGGAVYCTSSDATITDCLITGNWAEDYGGGIYCGEGNPTIERCRCAGNTASRGGGIYCYGNSATIVNCALVGNRQGQGAGFYCTASSPTLVSCAISGNTGANRGGGVHCDNSNATLTNCTIARNATSYEGGGVYLHQGEYLFSNCVVWGNEARYGSEITLDFNPTSLTVAYCDVRGGQAGVQISGGGVLVWEEGNIDDDPLLTRDGIHLRAGSPCENAGDPEGNYGDQTDIDGEPRVAAGRVDMGPDEFIDTEADGLPDWWELRYFGSPTAGDPLGDDDNDGRINLDEYAQSRDPFRPRTTYYVDPNGNDAWDGLAPVWNGEHGPKRTIQAAVDVTHPVEGDIIMVADGTYTGEGNRNIAFNGKLITVRSANGPAGCVIDCERSGRGFFFDSTYETVDSIVDGLTICDAFPGNFQDGGAVYCYLSSPWFVNCTFTQNEAGGNGGGVYSSYGSPKFTGCTFTENSADDEGAGLYLDLGWPQLIACTITENRAEDFGGGLCLCRCNATIVSCEIARNTAGDDGGGVCCGAFSNPTFMSCAITRNIADGGAGLFCDQASTPTLANCTLAENMARGKGGGGYCREGQMTIRNCILWGNTAFAAGDELALEHASAVVTVAYSDVQGGQAEVYIQSGWLDWGAGNIDADPLLVRNQTHLRAGSPCWNVGDPAGDYAELVDIDGEPRLADGRADIGADEFIDTDVDELPDWWEQLYFGSPSAADPLADDDNDGRINLDEYAESGNPMLPLTTYYVDPNGNDEWDGLAPVWNGEHGPKRTIQAAADVTHPVEGDVVSVADGIYTGPGNRNVAFYGKRITVRSANGPGACIIDCEQSGRGFFFDRTHEWLDSVVDGLTIRNAHTPDGYAGAGVYCYETSPTIINCTITDGAAGDEGGGVYGRYSRLRLVNCTITGNTAYPRGGGVYYSHGRASLVNCTIVGNTAPRFGGGVYCYRSSATITNCVLWGNSAPEGGQLGVHSTITGTTLTVSYSDSQGGEAAVYVGGSATLIWGEGNIDADPAFAFASDAHLMPGSPCIDAGTNDPPGGLPMTGADGNERPLDGDGNGTPVADMGAYEFNPAGPSIALAPATFSFVAVEGEPNPEQQILSLRNCGGGTLAWDIETGCDWVAAIPPNGQSGGEVNEVAVQLDISGLSNGSYTCILWVEDDQAVNSPRAVTIALLLNGVLNVPGEFSTIQAAINAAAQGDWVLVDDGTYTGSGNKNLNFLGKAIRVRSANGPTRCIIDCERDGRGFRFEYGETAASVVQGFTIRNAFVDGGGGAVHCDGSSPTITDCILTGNAVTGGGGALYCIDCEPTLTQCAILGNRAHKGGGIYCDDSDPVISGCTIAENMAAYCGGGLDCRDDSLPTISGCVIMGNWAGSRGGGVCASWSHPAMTNCVFVGNTAGNCGGGAYFRYGDSNLTNCSFAGNRADGSGGGMFVYSSHLLVTNCALWGNTAGRGGQLALVDDTMVTVSYCDVEGGATAIHVGPNATLTWGDGNIDADPGFAFADDLHLMPGSPCVDSGTNTPPGGLPPTGADGNVRPLDGDGNGTAVADMGAYEFNPAAASIALVPATLTLSMFAGHPNPDDRILSIRNCGGGTLVWDINENCDWLDVIPTHGESTGEIDDALVSVDASGLAHGLYACALRVADPQAVNNPRTVYVRLRISAELAVPGQYATIQEAIDAADDGDAMIVADGVYTGLGNKELNFNGKAITVRSADGPAACIIDCEGDGRAVYFGAGESIASVVDGFTITNGYSSYGGAIYCWGSPTIRNCRFVANRSEGNAGAIWIGQGCPTIRECHFVQNEAGDGGGAIANFEHDVAIVNCQFYQNRAAAHGGALKLTSGDVRLVNCLIAGNSASRGGGLYAYNNPTLHCVNCTLSGNEALRGGGIYLERNYDPYLINSVLWGNQAPYGTELALDQTVTILSVTSSAVQPGEESLWLSGGELLWGDGNITADPRLAFAQNPRLLSESLCVDAGTDELPVALPLTDVDGNPRIMDGDGNGSEQVDIGAHEFNPDIPSIALDMLEVSFAEPFILRGSGEQILSLRNCGGGTLYWGILEDCPWLEVTPTAGESTGEVDEVTVRVDVSSLLPGAHESTLMVTGVGAVNSPQIVPVRLLVYQQRSVPEEYATIQEAIDAAVAGDVVLLSDGTYTGSGNTSLNFGGKSVTVRSRNGPQACVIDCEHSSWAFRFDSGEGADATVDSVTIRNGYGYDGGAVYIEYSSPTIRDCVIQDCTAAVDGGAIYAYFASPTITGCTISENHAAQQGGGICSDHGLVRIDDCTLRDNTAGENGGGVCALGDAVLTDCRLSHNSAGEYGGGVWGGTLVSGCSILDNTAGSGGGVADCFRLSYCLIRNNRATSGGGICDRVSDGIVSTCYITENTAVDGAGIFALSTRTTILNCTLTRNDAYETGGAVWFSRGTTMLRNNILWQNSAAQGPELALVQADNPTTLSVSHCAVQGGQAAVYVENNCTLIWGEGNIALDPLFAFPSEYHLMPDSPCVEGGASESVFDLPRQDIDRNERVLDGDGNGLAVVDMGVHEIDLVHPAIGLSATEVDFFALAGGAPPNDQSLLIRNCGGATLHWQITEDCPWMEASPLSGESTGEINEVILHVDISGLAHGLHTCMLAVSDDAASNSPRVVQVTLHLNAVLPVPAEYATIQAAIDATVLGGDVVLVADGTYSGPGNKELDFHGRNIIVRSENGSTNCIIDCQDSGRGFYFHSDESRDALVEGFTIINGSADYGGAIFCENSSPTMTGCVLDGNVASEQGGGAYCLYSNALIADCTITQNRARTHGGGVYTEHSSPTITGCVISDNTATGVSWADSGGIHCRYGAPTISQCTISGNSAAADGGGGGCELSSATFGHCQILDNSAPHGGGLFLSQDTTTVHNCTFRGNNAQYGGAVYSWVSDARVKSCLILANWVYGMNAHGGAIHYENGGTPSTVNCNVLQNVASGINSSGGGIYCSGTNARVTSCIVRENIGDGGQIISVAGMAVVTYCNVQGGYTGPGNINADPLFADPQNYDFHLLADSLCIGTGDPQAFGVDEVDLDGQPRVMGGRVDMGIDEFTDRPFVFGDMNCDGVRNAFDIDPFVLALTDPAGYEQQYPDCDIMNADCNEDGIIDAFDIDPFVELLTGG